jgi:hypothetical protein
MSFSTLVATSAAEFNFWPGINDRPVVQGLVIYLLIPLMLVFMNAVKIEVSFSAQGRPSNAIVPDKVAADKYPDLWMVGSRDRKYQNPISCCDNHYLGCNQCWR